jgi:LytS/YehU family sensor histidine kinase
LAGADLYELRNPLENEPVEAPIEFNDRFFGGRWELLDDRLSLFDVVRLSQISDSAILRNEIDSCFLMNAISGLQILLKYVFSKSRECIIDLYVFSRRLFDSLNGILDVKEISDDNV